MRSPPPSLPETSHGSDPTETGEDPITADVHHGKNKKLDSWIIVVVAGSSITLIAACIGLGVLLLKWYKLRQLQEAVSPATTPAVNRRYGMTMFLIPSVVTMLFV